MGRIWIILLAAASLMGVAVPTVQARQLYIGINANTRAWGNPGEEQDLVAETGAGWLREDFEWERVEPSEGKWDWTSTDALYQEAAERGMEILPVLDSPPCWAVPKETDPEDCWQTYPKSNAAFATFVAHAVERYGPSGDFWDAHPGLDNDLAPRYWEIWNEPYYPSFTNGDVDPARYAALYKAAAAAGNEANSGTDYLIESVVDASVNPEVDPSGFVHWAKAIVKAEPLIGNYIDGIAIHPYPDHNDPAYEPENGTDASFRNTDINYQRWRELGINRQVWITEVGYSSCDDAADRCVPGTTQSERATTKAEWLSWLFDELGEDRYAFVHAVFLYNFRQWPDIEEPNADFSSWFGILNAEGGHLPAWNSFATAVEEYDGTPVANTTITGYSVEGSKATISFTVNDETSSLDCQIDEGTWTPCSSPKIYSGLGSGNHRFAVRATNSEATESFPAEIAWATRSAGTAADDSGTGTLKWANPSNAKVSDGSYATVEKASGTATAHYLKATNFGFSVPGGETIAGVEALVERSESGGSGSVVDSRVRIVKGGTIQSAVDKSTGAKWATTDTVNAFGGGADLWGQTWAPADINSSNFGVALSPTITGIGGTKKAQVDAIAITVFWH
jgi:hypothetical protein